MNKTPFNSAPSILKSFFFGMLMGVADLVPGISGGTVAFILGIYPFLIASLCSIDAEALSFLSRLELKKFAFHINLKFIAPLILGAASSILLFSKAVHFLLETPHLRQNLYSAFFGLVAASAIVCLSNVAKWDLKAGLFFLIGSALALICTQGVHTGAEEVSFFEVFHVYPWLILSGAVAISAMLLPGISGSYLLHLLGVYPFIIANLSLFASGLYSAHFAERSFYVLFSLLLGICLGALCFARVIKWTFAHYKTQTIAILIGFMVGALPTVWPFMESIQGEDGSMILKPALPEVFSNLFLINCLIAFFCFFLVIKIEKMGRGKERGATLSHAPEL